MGKKMLNAFFKELNDYNKIFLWVLAGNKKAIAFYESQGFKKDGKTKMLYEKSVIRMAKK